MQFFWTQNIDLDDATRALLNDVDEVTREVNDLRPLSGELVQMVQRQLLDERVYSSNAIEGNTLDLRETREVLRTGHVDIQRKREATEALNLKRAIEYAQENLVGQGNPYSTDTLLQVQGMLLANVDARAGRFRDERVMIHAAKHQPPNARAVPDMMGQCLDHARSGESADDLHPVVLASWVHWAIARIHPFFDGNGRMARLWQDILLFRKELTCAIVRPERRRDYLASLETADEGNFNPLVSFVAELVLDTFDKYKSAQKEADRLGEWVVQLVEEADAREVEKRKLAYLRWKRKMEQTRYEFQRCAASITQLAKNTEIQFRPFDMIDQPKWETLRSGPSASKTWFFELSFRRETEYVKYYFFFGKHFWTEADTDDERAEPRVSLLISERVGPEPARRLGDEGFETPLAIRELFVVGDQLVRKRFDPDQQCHLHDRGIDPIVVAQEFIRDVLLVRMG